MKEKRKIFPSKELGNLTAVLYSVSQDCFHKIGAGRGCEECDCHALKLVIIF